MVNLDIYFGMFSLSLNMLYSYISIIRGETFDFWGEWTLEDMEKNILKPPKQREKVYAWPALREKICMHGAAKKEYS